MTPDDREQMRADLAEILPKSAYKKIDEVLSYFGAVDTLTEVEIIGARVQVEQIEAYGLTIGLDANGNAVRVGFPYGAEVTG